MVTEAMKLEEILASWKEGYDKSKHCIKKHRHHFANRGLYSQNYGLSSSHVRIWELDHKEGLALKNWCFRIVLLEKTLESRLDSKAIKPVNPKGNQSWILIRRTDAEDPILCAKRPWCWERLKVKGEGGGKGWDG